jgi:tetratricopeptide (TPR) repeat protein
MQAWLFAMLQAWHHPSPGAQKEERQQLIGLLAADPDPLRQKLWQAAAGADQKLLEKLVGELSVADQPPFFLVMVARNPLLQGKPALALLRRAQQQHPQDFWVNFELALALEGSINPSKQVRAARAEELPTVNEVLRFYSVALALRPDNGWVYNNLGNALRTQGDVAGAIACFNKALQLDPKLAYAHTNLGNALAAQGDVTGAIVCFRKALQLDPRLAPAHTNLGKLLHEQGDRKKAVEHFQKALKLDPKDANAHNNLGLALYEQGDVIAAIACYTRALKLDPKDASAPNNFGLALQAQGDVTGAIVWYKKALQLDPKYARAHANLGTALRAQGDVAGAIACYHRALELDPRYAPAHYNLGNALSSKKDWAGAIACYKKALELDPKDAPTHNGLGAALRAGGDVAAAIACFKKALELDPKNARFHNNLGATLSAKKDWAGAIASYQKAVELDPKLVHAHGALGRALIESGRFSKAQTATQRALDLLPPDHPLRPLAMQQLHECQGLLELDARFGDVLKGKTQPKDTADRLQMADFAQRYKKRYAAAARFYQGAFAAKPKLTSGQRALFCYNAARAAALAAAGQGIDADKLDAKEKSRLRQQALAWLRDNLQEYAKQLEGTDAKTRQGVQQTLQHWQKDADFDSVRGKDALIKLPEAERTAWQQLWTDVAALLKKTQE